MAINAVGDATLSELFSCPVCSFCVLGRACKDINETEIYR